jgi:IclR family transcriptional regulator, acetate operon repressor
MQVRPLSTALKCLEVLEVVADQPQAIGISELGRLLGESRATTYQRLLTLTTAGWLERAPDGRYRLSTRACRIATAALEQAGFGERAQPILNEIAEEFGEAVSLVVLENDSVVIARRAESRGILRADLKVGVAVSFKDSSSGAIWLAFGPEDLIRRLTEAGIELPSKAQLKKVRAEGVSIGGGGKTLPGIRAIAVPVLGARGKCIASLSISTPATRFEPKRYMPSMLRAAQRLAVMASG